MLCILCFNELVLILKTLARPGQSLRENGTDAVAGVLVKDHSLDGIIWDRSSKEASLITRVVKTYSFIAVLSADLGVHLSVDLSLNLITII